MSAALGFAMTHKFGIDHLTELVIESTVLESTFAALGNLPELESLELSLDRSDAFGFEKLKRFAVRGGVEEALRAVLRESRGSPPMTKSSSKTESDRTDRTVPRIMTKRSRKRHVQLSLDEAREPTGHGGWRPRAGRPKGRKTISHDQRAIHAARNPVHVTLRLRADAPPIARDWLMITIRGAIKDSQKAGFRIVVFNILSNHIHLLAESTATSELSRGVQGFAGRLARRLNKKLKRSGKLFATRFHARALTSPRDVRNTLRYVLLNRKHHDTTTNFDSYWIDPFSSAPWFDGWAEPIRGDSWKHELAALPPPTERAKTWLLGVGWRRHGLLRFDERPRASAHHTS